MSSGKKLASVMMTVAMLLCLMACGGEEAPPASAPAEATSPATSTIQETAVATVALGPTPTVRPSPTRTLSIGPVVFSSGFDDASEEPVDVGVAFDQGISRLYAYWPYEGVRASERFRWDFFHDGSHFYGEYGNFGYDSGYQWQWIFETDGQPLQPGTYELVVKVGDQVVLEDSCEVREAPTPAPTQEPRPTATQVPTPTVAVAPPPTSTPTTPPVPTPTFSPTSEPRPGVGWVEVLNYCGSDMTFTIAGQMYTVGANSSQRIELSPGEYTYTASLGLGRYGDINGTVTVQAGVVTKMPFSANV
jgi:hypothetical protein